MGYCMKVEDIRETEYSLIGGKAAGLARLHTYCLPIPSWFVVKNEAFFDSLTEDQKELLQQQNWEALEETFKTFTFQDQVIKEILMHVQELNGTHFAIRSSAMNEDGETASYAGQYETFLWIDYHNILDAIKDCFLSGLSSKVAAYRKKQKIQTGWEIPAVIVQQMVQSDCAGVCFSVNPLDGDVSTSVINAVYGFGTVLVNSETNADTYYVYRNQKVVNREIGKKNIIHTIEKDQLVERKVGLEQCDQTVLQENTIIDISNLAYLASKVFGKYQDIEWAIEGGRLYLLQSRPITSLKNAVPLDQQSILFDNHIISEGYNGITLPLTFSYVRKGYEESYKQFCKLFGVTRKEIRENRRVFKNLIGLVDGRIYYNMNSWFQMISILPGYQFNRNIMKKLLNIDEDIPEEFCKEEKTVLGKIRNALMFVWGIILFQNRFVNLRKKVSHISEEVNSPIFQEDLTYLSTEKLYEYLYEVGYITKSDWDTPIFIDIFLKISHYALQVYSERWLKDKKLYNALLCGQRDSLTALPAQMIWEMSQLIVHDENMVQTFLTESVGVIEKEMEKYPVLKEKVSFYLEQFGDRCMDELKLESVSVRENPLLLYRSIGETARKKNRSTIDESDKIAKDARTIAKKKLAKHPWRKFYFFYMLRQADYLMRMRENVRFLRTRIFGFLRGVLNELGMRLASAQILENKEDIFYLEMDDIIAFIDGTATVYQLKELAKIKRKEYKEYAEMEGLSRFCVHGRVGQGVKIKQEEKRENKEFVRVLKGMPCSPGVVEGIARVVLDSRDACMKDGEILVANHTDPGWIMLFNQACAMVVECGSLLSHAAIVSREMGIPSVVAVDNVFTYLKTGDRIRVNGSTGVIEILERVK